MRAPNLDSLAAFIRLAQLDWPCQAKAFHPGDAPLMRLIIDTWPVAHPFELALWLATDRDPASSSSIIAGPYGTSSRCVGRPTAAAELATVPTDRGRAPADRLTTASMPARRRRGPAWPTASVPIDHRRRGADDLGRAGPSAWPTASAAVALGTQDRQLHHGPQLQAFMKPTQDDLQSAQFVSRYGPATRLFQSTLKQLSG